MRSEGLIVVGVDGSGSAQAALEFALEEAVRWSARVTAVTAFPTLDYWPVAVPAEQAATAGTARA